MSYFVFYCVSFNNVLITSVGEERAFFLLSFTCNSVVSVRVWGVGVLFLLVLGLGCVILLFHSLVFPYTCLASFFKLKGNCSQQIRQIQLLYDFLLLFRLHFISLHASFKMKHRVLNSN